MTVSPSLFVAKDQSRLVIESFGVKTIVFSQTNSSVGVMKKKKKKKKMEKIEAMYGGIGVSAPSLHRESTDSLIHISKYTKISGYIAGKEQVIKI